MAYDTGSATTVDALMDAVVAFAVAQAAMTQTVSRVEDFDAGAGVDNYDVVCLSKGGSHWWLRWKSNTVFGMPATSSAGATWTTITGRPLNDCQWFPIFEPFTSYHLFSDGTCVHVFVEMSNGSYSAMSFGDMTKWGTWTGGAYFDTSFTSTASTQLNQPAAGTHSWLFDGRSGSSAPGYGLVRVQFNDKEFARVGVSNGGAAVVTYNRVFATGFAQGVYDEFIANSPNAINNRSAGVPVMLFLNDDIAGGTNLLTPLGFVPGIRLINIKNLNPKDLVNTDWMVFPMQSKNAGLVNVYANSLNYGWAVRR